MSCITSVLQEKYKEKLEEYVKKTGKQYDCMNDEEKKRAHDTIVDYGLYLVKNDLKADDWMEMFPNSEIMPSHIQHEYNIVYGKPKNCRHNKEYLREVTFVTLLEDISSRIYTEVYKKSTHVPESFLRKALAAELRTLFDAHEEHTQSVYYNTSKNKKIKLGECRFDILVENCPENPVVIELKKSADKSISKRVKESAEQQSRLYIDIMKDEKNMFSVYIVYFYAEGVDISVIQ